MATGFDKRATTLSERQVVMHESGGREKRGESDAAGSSSDGRRRAAEAAAGVPHCSHRLVRAMRRCNVAKTMSS